MRFWLYKLGGRRVIEGKSLCDLIGFGEKEIISVVGGGGKTHTVYQLGKELFLKGKRVVLCTTTAMMYPEEYVYEGESLDEISALTVKNYVICGTRIGPRKMGPPKRDLFERLDSVCDYLVVEADGSRQLPLKFPQSHEPVLHERSSFVLGLAGIDALGGRICEICHRAEEASKILRKGYEDIISEDDIASILESKDGQMKNVDCRYIPVINKVDNEETLKMAEGIASHLMSHDCIFSSYLWK